MYLFGLVWNITLIHVVFFLVFFLHTFEKQGIQGLAPLKGL